MEIKRFYRVANMNTQQGLWYDFEGNFTGNIHTKYKFCSNHNLPMPYNEDIKGWLSSTDTLETLFYWFTIEDILELGKYGYCVVIYESSDYKEHENHWVINQVSAVPIIKLNFEDVLQNTKT